MGVLPVDIRGPGVRRADDGSVYLAQLPKGSAEAYTLYYVNNTVAGKKQGTKPSGCTEQDINDGNQKLVGELTCVEVGKKLYAFWYTTDDGVVGVAQVDTSPRSCSPTSTSTSPYNSRRPGVPR